jgi:hypothetical protein
LFSARISFRQVSPRKKGASDAVGVIYAASMVTFRPKSLEGKEAHARRYVMFGVDVGVVREISPD